MADIAIIKASIRANNGFIRRIMAAPVLGGVFVGVGLAFVILLLSWEYFLHRYSSVGAMPPVVLWSLVAVTLGTLVVLSVWKFSAFSRASQKIDERYGWTDVVKDLANHPVVFQQLIVLVMTVYLSTVAGTMGAGYLVPAVISGGVATVFMLYASAFLLTEYIVLSLWFYLFVAVSVLLPGASPLVMIAVGFGAGFIGYGIWCLYRAARDSRRDGRETPNGPAGHEQNPVS